MRTILYAAAAISLISTGFAMADTTPVTAIAGSSKDLINMQNLTNQRLPQQPAQVQVPRADDYRGSNAPLPPISTVTFNGPTVLTAEELTSLTQPYLDRPITDNDVAQLKNAIANEYEKRGYPLVKVATPSQDLTDGELTINIYEGRVGNVIANTNGVLADYIPEAFGGRLKGEVFDAREAEEVVNDLNEINNTTSSITLRPGIEPLTTDLVLNVQPGGAQDVNYVAVDNYGNKLTGEYVGSLHLEKTNFFNHGEKLSFDGRVSDEELYAAGVGLRIPTGFKNTFLETSYLYSENDIVDRLEFLDASGKSHIFNIGLTGNLINQDDQKLTLRGGLDVRNHESFLAGVTDTDDKVRRAYIGATYLGIAPEISTIFLVDGKLSKGLNILGASEEGDSNLTRAQADPQAVIFEPSVFVRHDFTPADKLSFSGRAQLASEVLLSSDLFILGGYGSVRGFDPAQEVGERGWSATLEYQHQFALTDNLSLDVGPWVDGGRVYNELPNQTVDDALYSAGLGAQFTANIIPVGETTLRLDWAHPLGNYDSQQVDDNSFYFRVQQNF